MSYNVYESLGKRLWECREKLKLSREAFAGKCDISPQFLAEIEHGRKGISVAGTCTIQGGTIAGCFDPRIGAAITCSSSGTLIMTGGKIMYNRSKLSDGGLAGVIYGEAPIIRLKVKAALYVAIVLS